MPFAIYLLHFDRHVGRSLHYLGITRADRLEKRLAEHQARRGASLTSRAVDKRIGFTLANLWITENPQLERTLKQRGHAKKLCTVCAKALPATPNDCIGRRWSPRPQEPRWCDQPDFDLPRFPAPSRRA